MSPGTAPGRRNAFVTYALEAIGSPYIWGGKGELREDPGSDRYVRVFDCSGLVTWSLYQATNFKIDWRKDWNADRIWKALPHTDEPELGDLAFYGVPPTDPQNPKTAVAHHVVIVCGGGLIVGANRGNSDCTSIAIARKHEARVQVNPLGVRYRRDFLGFGSLSQYLTT